MTSVARAGVPPALLIRAGSHVCALPVTEVIEILRPLPIEPISPAPDYVPGVSVLRGAPAAVVRLSMLLGVAEPAPPERFVAIRVGLRTLILAVDSVLGLRQMDAGRFIELPPLLRAAGAERIEALGVLDSELLMVLNSGRLLTDDVWDAITGKGAPA